MVDGLTGAHAVNMTATQTHTTRALVLGASVLLSLTLSACTGPATSSPSSTANTDGSPATASTQGDEEALLPLEAYEASLDGGAQTNAERFETRYQEDQKREGIVAVCMKEEGFSYFSNARKIDADSVGPRYADSTSRAWVEQYGYGAVYVPDGVAGEIARTTVIPGTEPGQTQSPNEIYVASLDPAEKAAWNKALYGEQDDTSLTLDTDWERLGCLGKGTHEVPTNYAKTHTSLGLAVEQAITDFLNGYSTWPGISDASASWAACMTQSGFSGYETPDDPAQEFIGKNNDLWAVTPEPAVPAKADLDALASKEKTVALADLDCKASTDYDATIRDIQRQLEEQFMADNAAQLDAYKAERLQK